MTKPLILVTAPTGKTGMPVVKQLLEKGYPVRAFVHRLSQRAELLRRAIKRAKGNKTKAAELLGI